jgi:hypothetical protein
MKENTWNLSLWDLLIERDNLQFHPLSNKWHSWKGFIDPHLSLFIYFLPLSSLQMGPSKTSFIRAPA